MRGFHWEVEYSPFGVLGMFIDTRYSSESMFSWSALVSYDAHMTSGDNSHLNVCIFSVSYLFG